jgi:hypothetical protein
MPGGARAHRCSLPRAFVNVLDSMKDRLQHAVSASCPDELHNARCAVIKVKDADRDEVVHRAILSIICQSINSPTVIRELGHACFPTVTDTFLVPWAGTVHSVAIPTLKDPFTGSMLPCCILNVTVVPVVMTMLQCILYDIVYRV